jgi:hypothetical protein
MHALIHTPRDNTLDAVQQFPTLQIAQPFQVHHDVVMVACAEPKQFFAVQAIDGSHTQAGDPGYDNFCRLSLVRCYNKVQKMHLSNLTAHNRSIHAIRHDVDTMHSMNTVLQGSPEFLLCVCIHQSIAQEGISSNTKNCFPWFEAEQPVW